MTHPIFSVDIDFSPVPRLIATGKVIPMTNGSATGMYLHVHIRYIQTLPVHSNLYFKLSTGHGLLMNKTINREKGMLEAGHSQQHVVGVLGVSQSTVARIWERFGTHGNARYRHGGGRKGVSA